MRSYDISVMTSVCSKSIMMDLTTEQNLGLETEAGKARVYILVFLSHTCLKPEGTSPGSGVTEQLPDG